MDGYTKVNSIEKLEVFKAALCKFVETAGRALDEADSEIQNTLIWLRQDQ